jgi:hypothetical protein
VPITISPIRNVFSTRTRAPWLLAAIAALTATVGLGLATVADSSSTAVASVSRPAKVTRHSLLHGSDFTRHGFARAEVSAMEGDGGVSTPECEGPEPGQSRGFVNSRANLYQGAQTDAVETAVQFRHPSDAARYAKVYRAAVNGCQAMLGMDLWRTSSTHRLHLAHTASADYWTVNEDTIGITVYRTISVVQRGGRVGVLTLESTTSHPERTTRVPALMKDMSRRLAAR